MGRGAMTTAESHRIGRLIRLARAEAGMTQAQLADAIGVARITVGEWERGVKLRYTRADAIALEQALGVHDRRFLKALGYEQPTPSGPHAVNYPPPQLTPEQEAEILQYIEWLRYRETPSWLR